MRAVAEKKLVKRCFVLRRENKSEVTFIIKTMLFMSLMRKTEIFNVFRHARRQDKFGYKDVVDIGIELTKGIQGHKNINGVP